MAVGRVKDPHLAALCAEYGRRLGRYGPFEAIEVKDARGGTPQASARAEGERLLAKIDASAILLDERGEERTSRQLADWLTRAADEGQRDLTFVIGGAWGLSDDVLRRCSGRMRLSSMTLTHEMSRLLLLEQLYRARTIQRGAPYHHGERPG